MPNQKTPLIVFVCEHGAAKSVIAAAYFNKLAEEVNAEARAVARGTNPDAEFSPKTIAGLRADGLSPALSAPQQLSLDDLNSAERIVTFCEMPEEYQNKIAIETWDGVPAVSENYELARDEIIQRLRSLFQK